MSGMTGRFLTRDPIGYVSDINLYRYCDSRPHTLVDPTGLDWLDNLANFSAGISDSLTMSGTSWVRDLVGINDGIEADSGWYMAGEATEIVVEVTVTAGAAASRHVAKHAIRKTLEGNARQLAAKAYKRTYNVQSVIVHHATPIKGHIGGVPSYFPLPYRFAAQGKWNFQYLSNVGQHAAMHRRLRNQEMWLRRFNFSQPIRNGVNLIIQHGLEIGPNNHSFDSLPFVSLEIKMSGQKIIAYDSCDPKPSGFEYGAAGGFNNTGFDFFIIP